MPEQTSLSGSPDVSIPSIRGSRKRAIEAAVQIIKDKYSAERQQKCPTWEEAIAISTRKMTAKNSRRTTINDYLLMISNSELASLHGVQGDGDSIRRQTALAKAWCDRHNVRLDFNTTFTDRGKSAFRGKHRLTAALGVFLAEVKAGHIPRGSVLIVENLDRLSREDTYEAINLLTSLVVAGVSVVTLSPSEMVYEKRSNNLGGLISAVVEFGRANSVAGSMKDRSDQNWLMKKSLARESRKIMTAAVPAWIAKRDRDVPAIRNKKGKLVQPKALVLDGNGKMTLDRTKAETVRRIFKMAAAGFSAAQIVRKLIADKIPPLARSEWSAAYIFKILHGREVLGELQPRTNGKKPDGAPIPNYYPPVVDEGDLGPGASGDRWPQEGAGAPRSAHIKLDSGIGLR